jgi:hypothetical protein
MPAWFEDYQKGILGKANAVGGEPFQQYHLPSLQSLEAVANSRVAQNNGYINYGRQLGQDAATSYKPTLNSGIDATKNAIGMEGALSASQPAYDMAMSQPGAMQTANPYLAQGALSWPTQAANYMNPFTDQVASRLVDVSNRNLFENVLPGINDNFVKTGMFGASRQGDFTGRAVRDQNESLLGALSNTYSTAYNQGAQQFGADAGRQLQAGQIAGSLTSQDMQNYLNAANLQGNFANMDRTTTGNLGKQMGDLASTQQRLGLTGASIYEGIGKDQMAMDQRNLDVNYNNFLEQRDYPKTQLAFMNSLLRGMQVPQTTTQTNTAPASNYNAPPFAQLLGAATGIAGMLGAGKAEGGRVGFLRGGRVRRGHGYLSKAA